MFRLLFALTFLFFCAFSQAQTTDSTKMKSRLYFDLELGVFSFGGDGLSPLGISSINTGFRINNEIALGLSLRGWVQPSDCCSTSAGGAGIQLRWSPESWLIKIETGMVTGAGYGDDGNYYSKYNYEKSNKAYTNFSIATRFSEFVTLGLAWASTTSQINDRFDSSTKAFLGTTKFDVSEITLVFGLAFPKY
jgi:hypothetical protein